MKNITFLSLLCSLFLMVISCNKKEVEIEIEETFELVGEWEEKFPELHDRIADTLVFTNENIVKEHFFFDGFSYEEKIDTIIIFQNEYVRKYFFEIINPSEMIIFNFLDRSALSNDKNIHYQKI